MLNLVDKVIPHIFVAAEGILPQQDYFFGWSPSMEFTVEQIAGFLKGKLKGDADRKVSSLATIEEAQPHQITFLSNPKYEPCVYTTSAAAIIVSAGFVPKKDIQPSLIFVDDPYSSFTALLEEYSKYINKEKTGVESPVYVGRDVTMGEGVYQGAFSYVGDHVVIGDGVKIYPHVFIGDRVVIGDRSILYPGAKLYAGTQLGKRCVIHAGAVIGSDGFGFAPQKDGSYKTIPQLGDVILGDDVSIGANTTVDRATLYGHATRVNEGTKIDNLVQIAHNVEIGSHTVMAAQAGISGSTKIGDHCVIAGQVGVIGHLKVASRTTIGAQAGVIRSVTAEGEQLLGSPSVHTKDYLRSYAVFRKLPDMYIKLEQIERKLAE